MGKTKVKLHCYVKGRRVKAQIGPLWKPPNKSRRQAKWLYGEIERATGKQRYVVKWDLPDAIDYAADYGIKKLKLAMAYEGAALAVDDQEEDLEGLAADDLQPRSHLSTGPVVSEKMRLAAKQHATKTLTALVGDTVDVTSSGRTVTWTVIEASSEDTFGIKLDGPAEVPERTTGFDVFKDFAFNPKSATCFLEIFERLWPGDMAAQVALMNEQGMKNTRAWIDITVYEFLIFLGLLLDATGYGESATSLWDTEAQRSRQQSNKPAPDFGRFMLKLRFNQIRKYAHYGFADLVAAERDPWEMFRPAVRAFNANRLRTVNVSGIIVGDESMSSWKPQSSAYGGLPNISFVIRKPRPLGTELKDIVDGQHRIMLFLELQEGEAPMKRKAYFADLGSTAACAVRMSLGTLGLTTDTASSSSSSASS